MRAAHHAKAARRRHRIARACAITPAGALLADPWARRVQEARADALERRLARAHPVLATALEDPDLWKELGIEPTRSWVEVLGDAIHARLIRELVFCGFRPPGARAEAGERVFHREYQARFVEDLCRCGYSREAIYRGQAPHLPCHGAEVLPALANENNVRTRVVYTPQGTSRRVPAEDDRRCQCGRSAAEILETVRTARRQMADLNRYTCHGVQATPRTVSTRATRAFYTPQGGSAVPIEPWSRYDTDGTRYAIPPNDLDPTLAESAFAQIPVRMAEAAARGLEDHVARILLEDGTEWNPSGRGGVETISRETILNDRLPRLGDVQRQSFSYPRPGGLSRQVETTINCRCSMDFAHLLQENPGAEELREAGFPIPEGSRALVKGWTVEIPAGGAVDPEIQVEIVCLEEPPTLSPAIYQATSPGAEPVERKGRTGRRLIVNADGTLPEIPEGEDYAELDRVRDRGVPAFSAKVLGSSFAGASAAAAATSGALKALGAELRKAAEKMAEAQTALEGRTLGWGDVNAMNRSLAEDVRDLCHRIMADGDLSAEEVDGLIGALHAKPTAEQPAPLLDYFQEHLETLHHAAERSKVHALPYLTLEGLDSAPGDAWTVRRSRGALGAVAPAPEGGRRTELGSRSVEFTIESKLDPLESRRLREFLGALDDPTGAGFLIQTPAQAARAAELESYFPSIRKDWGKGPSLGVGDAVRVRVDGVNRPGTVAGFEGRNVLVNVGAHAGRALAFRPEDVVPDRHLLPAKSATDALLAWCDRKGVPLSAAPLIANHIHRRALYQGEGAPPRPEHMIPGERWTEMTTRGPRFYVDRGGPRRDHAGRAGRAHGGDRWRTSQPASR